ncbi:MAG: SMC-Scp complex subunit ScpB [Candidatus Diapherotrites archaeon]|nr:SMC-Scp complex subunit ScpB [Candidatus Diapherotrites archaeon]
MEDKKLLEAALFMSPDALDLKKLARVLKTKKYSYVEAYLKELKKDYFARDTAIELTRDENGKYRLKVKDKYLEKVAFFAAEKDLGKKELETLAYVAYHEPVKQSSIVQKVRSSSYDYIKKLKEHGFISKEIIDGERSPILKTTKKFRDYFGTDAIALKEMIKNAPAEEPTLEDYNQTKEQEKNNTRQEKTDFPQQEKTDSTQQGTQQNNKPDDWQTTTDPVSQSEKKENLPKSAEKPKNA